MKNIEQKQSIDFWIHNRKSTFLNGLQEGGTIKDEVIYQLLENASWAPSHGLAQTWFFKVFSGKGVDTFYKKQQDLYKSTTPVDKFNEIKFSKFPEKSKYVSHVIAIISKRDPKRRFPAQEDLVSVACATQNIYLSMLAYGIAGYLSTGDICYQEEMREYLQLDVEDECIGFFTLGLPKDDVKRPTRKRIPVNEKMEWIRD